MCDEYKLFLFKKKQCWQCNSIMRALHTIFNYISRQLYCVMIPGFHLHTMIDFSQVRSHVEFSMDENEAVRERLTVFTMARTV